MASAARIARPSAPPNSREVFTRPEASPASSWSTPATAAIVTGTNARPSPIATSSDGARIVADVRARRRQLREQQQSDRQHRHAGDEQRLGPDPRDRSGGDRGGGDDAQRHREERQPGPDRRVAADLLQVQRQEEPHREHGCAEQQHDHVGRAERARGVDPQRHQRLRAIRPSITHERGQQHQPDAISASVGSEPQPVTSVRTMPSTSSDRPSVALSAPARSKLRDRSRLRLSAISRCGAQRARSGRSAR